MAIIKKRNYLFLLLCVICSVSIYAQPRVDGGVTAKIVKSSQVVTSIVGWEYNMAHKKWAGYYNTLNNLNRRNNNKVPIKLSPSDMSGCDNVISLQFKLVIFEGDAYYMLCAPRYIGTWRYPTICEDWFYSKVTCLYIFTSEEYAKLKNLQEGINVIKTIKFTNYDERDSFGIHFDFNSAFNELFESKDKLFEDDPMTWYVKKEDEKTIRFQCISYAKLETGKVYDIANSPNFDMRYFEISYNNFSKLFIKE